MKEKKCCLLIGNTRWHWALENNNSWSFTHTQPSLSNLKSDLFSICKWAAVGPVPKNHFLTSSTQLKITEVPLLKLPLWLGIDRALAGWQAFQKAKAKNMHSNGLLIADAGTILSLTKITSTGEFDGGQLIPGLRLQQSAMANGTENLNQITQTNIPPEEFPMGTEEAMIKGSLNSLLGTLLITQREEKIPIWLCGGDSELLLEHLQALEIDVNHCPNLVLEGMINLIN
ncbi:type III pantothenate kinase [Prochlorococcus marinus]|uniref:Type III pantothenate kinase n=1 Tax=Prochlorococcus marinus (strain MIT 9211) TaxID=93059 RepID=A9B9G5_PROM4|nr:type III pantothenate kinase [Prochlorococcus marinus]ABX08020.1 Predicted transcriptional regulator [Prochlorococcus marinus str. MIT 9211]